MPPVDRREARKTASGAGGLAARAFLRLGPWADAVEKGDQGLLVLGPSGRIARLRTR